MVVFFWWARRRQQELISQFIQSRLLPGLLSGVSSARQKLRMAALVAAVVFLIFALARPQWGFSWEEVKQRGLDIVVAIDTSKSMLATDIAPNRLTRAKLAALDLMQQAKSDRLGLVAFAGSAFLQCPLTFDDSAFRQSLDALNVDIIPQGGTALAEAIETAQQAFKDGDNYKILVLFTDGEDHDSNALEAAQKAAKAGMHIFTIGVGTTEGEMLRYTDPKGNTDFVRDEQGHVVKSHLNEQLLQEIAGATEGGFYLPLRGAKTIDTLYDQGLSKGQKTQHEEKLVKQYFERYHWPLAIAILLLIFEMVLPERNRATRNATAPSETRSGLKSAAVVLLLIAFIIQSHASPSSALREYEAGKFDESLKEYQKLLEKQADDPRLHYNAGAAAYRSRQFDEATKQFNQALSTPDLNLQALSYYNRGNALFHLGDSLNDPSKRTETWEKSVKDFENTLKLKPEDHDAKFNRDFVKKKLEELKQQQQQQNNSDNKQNKDQQNQQDQQQNQQKQKSDQEKNQDQQQKQDQQQQQQDQQKQGQQQQDQQKQQDQQQQQQQAKQQEQDKQKQAQDQKQKQQEQQQQQQQAESGEKPEDKAAQDAAAYAAGQMTPDQAKQLLDAQKGDEKILQFHPDAKPRDTSKPIKDW
jgi:Ca-activated chloride channel family protein